MTNQKEPQQKSPFPSEFEKRASEFGHTSAWFFLINSPWFISTLLILKYHFVDTGK